MNGCSNWGHDGGENLHAAPCWLRTRVFTSVIRMEVEGDSGTGWEIQVGCLPRRCMVEDHRHDLGDAKARAFTLAERMGMRLFGNPHGTVEASGPTSLRLARFTPEGSPRSGGGEFETGSGR